MLDLSETLSQMHTQIQQSSCYPHFRDEQTESKGIWALLREMGLKLSLRK